MSTREKASTQRRSAQTDPIRSFMAQSLAEARAQTGGAVADYIPELARFDANLLGAAITTCDGTVYAAGDAETPFTIQSISKAFTYALALQRHGREAVLRKVGVEPTGDAFNAILLDHENNRPFNPMVNAGAIATTDLLMQGEADFDRDALLRAFSAFAGEPLTIDEAVYRSELTTGHRNRAIAYLMLGAGMLEGEPGETLERYFEQCSISVTCRTLSTMAAVLANDGCNPVTGERVLSEAVTQDVLTVLSSCGMYNYAGQWAFEIGMPAKSGVSGAIIAVAPGQFGVAAFAPPVDQYGASPRAVAFCRTLSDRFELHSFRNRLTRAPVIRRTYQGFDRGSSRERSRRESETLAAARAQMAVLEAQGRLFFASAETLIRRIDALCEDARYLLIDFRRVQSAERQALELIVAAVRRRIADGVTVMFSHTQGAPELAQALDAYVGALAENGNGADSAPLLYDSSDQAIEWCEERVLAEAMASVGDAKMALGALDLFQGFSPDELKLLEQNVQAFIFKQGDIVLNQGDDAKLFFVVASGAVAVTAPTPDGAVEKIASIGPGLPFGEMALLDGGARSATVIAEKPLICYGLSVAFFEADEPGRLEMRGKLLSNLARQLSARLRRANVAIQTLL